MEVKSFYKSFDIALKTLAAHYLKHHKPITLSHSIHAGQDHHIVSLICADDEVTRTLNEIKEAERKETTHED